MPVIYAASGNCHVYVDASADLDDGRDDHPQRQDAAPRRVQRGGDAARARATPRPTFLPRALRAAARGRASSCASTPARARWPATLADDAASTRPTRTGTPSSSTLILAVGVVDSLEEAIEHINAHGSGHSEAIVTHDTEAARAFTRGVDAACVYVNASTRFTDGGEFGMGAEIGISTQKLHARGPIGLRELCTYKYVVQGSGPVRPWP